MKTRPGRVTFPVSEFARCGRVFHGRLASPHADIGRRAPVPAAARAVAPAGADAVLARLLEDLRRNINRVALADLLPPVLVEFVPAARPDAPDAPLQCRRLVPGRRGERRRLEPVPVRLRPLDLRGSRDLVVLGLVGEVTPTVAALVAVVGRVLPARPRVRAKIDQV